MSDTFVKTAAETLTFADIVAKAKPVQRTVFLYLAGDLLARRDQLDDQIEEAARLERAGVRNGEDLPDRGLAEVSPTDGLVDELAEVLEQLRDSRTGFTFGAMPRTKWDALRKQYENSKGETDLELLSVPLIAACLLDPPLPGDPQTDRVAREAAVDGLFESLNHSQRQDLFNGAWAVNTGAVDIPFSPAGSAAEKARRSAKR